MAYQITSGAVPANDGSFFPFYEKLAGPKGSGGTPAKKGGAKKGGSKKGGSKKGGAKKSGAKKR